MQTYAPGDAPRSIPVPVAHCGRSAPGSARACLPCRRRPSLPSRIAPGVHHALMTPAGSQPAVRLADRSRLICASARPGTAPIDRPSCGLQMARGHRRHGKPPAGLRRAQRNHASGLRPWLSLPCYRRPSRPAIASPLRPSWHTPPSGACGSPLATVCPPGPPAPLRAPAAKPVRGTSKLHNEELSAACRLSGSRPDNFRYAKCRPSVTRPRPPWLSGCAGSHCVARFRPARLPPVRPRRWLPKSRRWRDGDLWISGLFSPSMHHE